MGKLARSRYVSARSRKPCTFKFYYILTVVTREQKAQKLNLILKMHAGAPGGDRHRGSTSSAPSRLDVGAERFETTKREA